MLGLICRWLGLTFHGEIRAYLRGAPDQEFAAIVARIDGDRIRDRHGWLSSMLDDIPDRDLIKMIRMEQTTRRRGIPPYYPPRLHRLEGHVLPLCDETATEAMPVGAGTAGEGG